jgi:hypothetical protein
MDIFYVKSFIAVILSYCLSYTYDVLLNTGYLLYSINIDILLETLYCILSNIAILYFIYFLNKYIPSWEMYLNCFYYVIAFYIYYIYLDTLRWWFALIKSVVFSFIICVMNISGIDFLINF